MNRSSFFNSPFLLGFDHFERLLERTQKASNDGYPPYNIEETGPDRLRIILAVAGFSRNELDVTVEDNQLVIRGKQTESPDKTFLHRGIAARQFHRAFVLADGIEVTGAELENGLLSIALARPKPESITRKIDIVGGNGNQEGRAEGDRQ
jgi:HSP20 family molecular chaperone IbpA